MSRKKITDGISEITDIIASAEGEIVGRTRLQKTAFLLEVAGLGSGFDFFYKHYGPFSQEVADAAQMASIFGEIKEDKRPTSWGGTYSIFTTSAQLKNNHPARKEVVSIAKGADPIALELAATAVFLSHEGFSDPWGETENRKPDKATEEKLDEARRLYSNLKKVNTPEQLPGI